jgi:hypothetical protein
MHWGHHALVNGVYKHGRSTGVEMLHGVRARQEAAVRFTVLCAVCAIDECARYDAMRLCYHCQLFLALQPNNRKCIPSELK